MLLRRRRRVEAGDAPTAAPDRDVIVEHGPSFAKGPNLTIGTILLVYGLSGLLKNAAFPHAASSFPNGSPQGTSWLGPEVNGWTSFFCIAAGGLLLFGAAQHHLAKLMSLLTGLALGACAVIALVSDNVLGLAAANGWTELGWGIAAVILVLNAFSPRARREREVAPATGAMAASERRARFARRPATQEPATGRAPAMTGTSDRAPQDDGS